MIVCRPVIIAGFYEWLIVKESVTPLQSAGVVTYPIITAIALRVHQVSHESRLVKLGTNMLPLCPFTAREIVLSRAISICLLIFTMRDGQNRDGQNVYGRSAQFLTRKVITEKIRTGSVIIKTSPNPLTITLAYPNQSQ